MFRFRTVTLLAVFATAHLAVNYAEAAHKVLMFGSGKFAIVDKAGKVEWSLRWNGVHDIHVLPNGNIMTQRGMRSVVEIDRESKKIVWSYDAANSNGNKGKRVEVHAFQPLDNGHIMIAESGPGRIIEIDRDGKIHHQIKLQVKQPNAHRDTRLARKLDNGNYLVCHEGDGVLKEYEGKSGKVVWEFPIPLFGKPRKGGHGPDAFGNQLFCAVRLKNGNTLVATGNGHSVLEVTPKNEIVWKIEQNDLPGITLAWVTTLEVLPNGNYVIGNCHAGPKNPLLIEVEPKTKKVVWTFDRFDVFGNNASNSQLLNVEGDVIR